MGPVFLDDMFVVTEENVEMVAVRTGIRVDKLRTHMKSAADCNNYYVVHIQHAMTPKT